MEIGPVPSKDRKTRKIPLKDDHSIKHHSKVQTLPEITILLEFIMENFDLACFSIKQEYKMTLLPLAHGKKKLWACPLTPPLCRELVRRGSSPASSSPPIDPSCQRHCSFDSSWQRRRSCLRRQPTGPSDSQGHRPLVGHPLAGPRRRYTGYLARPHSRPSPTLSHLSRHPSRTPSMVHSRVNRVATEN